MNPKNIKLAMAAITLPAMLLTCTAKAQHTYTGVVDANGNPATGAGNYLSFVDDTTDANAGSAIASGSLGVLSMNQVLVGNQAGLYMNSQYTYTVLSNGLNWTGSSYRAASPYAPVSGTFVVAEITGVTGPSGSHFSLWDTLTTYTAYTTTTGGSVANASSPIDTWTIGGNGTGTLTLGTSAYYNGSLVYSPGDFNLSDPTLVVGDGMTTNPAPSTVQGTTGVDPYGHVHGRQFTADEPGTYTIEMVLHDINGNEKDSTPFEITFQAVPEPAVCGLLGGGLAFLGLMRRRRRNS